MKGLEEHIRELVRAEVERILAERDGAAAGSRLLKVKQYAAQMSISPSTVWQAIHSGRLKFERIGRSVRVPADAKITATHQAADSHAQRADRALGIRKWMR